MARPNDDFRVAWAALQGDGSAAGWETIAVAPAGTVLLQVGRRTPDGAEALLLSFPGARLPAAGKLPDGQGFSVERADSADPDLLTLALTRRSAGSTDLFTTMVCDVAGCLDDAVASSSPDSSPLRVFLRRVGAWQEFMRKGGKGLSPEAEVGLVGELILLEELLKSSVSPVVAVDAWVGPLGGVQDFELGHGALEAKATLSTSGFVVRIGSLEQLDDPHRQPLCVAGLRLQLGEAGRTLPALVEDLRHVFTGEAEAARVFGERLIAAGYLDAHEDRYARGFLLRESQILEVDGRFPRLTPGNVPLGITRAMYEIDLGRVAGERLTLHSALKRLGLS